MKRMDRLGVTVRNGAGQGGVIVAREGVHSEKVLAARIRRARNGVRIVIGRKAVIVRAMADARVGTIGAVLGNAIWHLPLSQRYRWICIHRMRHLTHWYLA